MRLGARASALGSALLVATALAACFSDGNASSSSSPSSSTSKTPSTTECASGTKWTSGDHGSSKMRPGAACIDCHSSKRGAPKFTVAGTLFTDSHDPDDCNGSDGATIVITDADGQVTEIQPNSVGNFRTSAAIAMPYSAKVIAADGTEKKMTDTQTDGDCNGCHTEQGANKAPGRIVVPK